MVQVHNIFGQAFGVLGFLALCAPVQGSSFVERRLDEVSRSANSVHLVRVISERSFERAGLVWTEYEVRVLDTLKGHQPSSRVTRLHIPGGKTSAGVRVHVSHIPHFEFDREYLIFLDRELQGEGLNLLTYWTSFLISQDARSGERFVVVTPEHSITTGAYRGLQAAGAQFERYENFIERMFDEQTY